MGRSNALRLSDIRGAMRLVGDCRDLGRDPHAWMTRVADGCRPLVGADVVFGSLCSVPGGLFYPQPPLVMVDVGWESPAHRAVWADCIYTGYHLRSVDFLAYLALRQPGLTASRRRLVTDRTWYASEEFNRYRRRAGVDNYIVGTTDAPAGPTSTFFNVQRAVGRPAFRRREVRLTSFLRHELTRLVGTALADGLDPAAALPPRLRQVLEALLEGDSQKQVAVRLGLSRHTVHEYAKDLYRRLGVASRGELHARFQRPAGGPG